MDELIEIRDSVQKISEAIASVLNMDVIISDAQFRKIGDTKKHFNLEVKYIKDSYVIGKVLQTGKVRVISGKEDSENCIVCAEKGECNLQAMICVPIRYSDSVIGAIGLIAINAQARTVLLENQANLVGYIERMADLIVSKLLEKEATDKLTVARNQLVSIMNSIDEGIAAVDENGRIIYLNSILQDILGPKVAGPIGENALDIFPDRYVADLIQSGTPFSNIELRIKNASGDAHALISGRPVSLGEKNAGSILAFKKMEDVYEVINNLTSSNRTTSFDEIVGDSREIVQLKEKAMKVAGGGSNILITEPPRRKALYRDQLRRHAGDPHRERTVRIRRRILHRGCPRRQAGEIPARPRRHRLPGRDRRYATTSAAETSAGPPGEDHRKDRRTQERDRRRAHDRGDEQES